MPQKVIPNHVPLYIRFNNNKVAKTREIVEDCIMMDYDKNGWPIGIELLGGFRIEGAPMRVKTEKRKKKKPAKPSWSGIPYDKLCKDLKEAAKKKLE